MPPAHSSDHPPRAYPLGEYIVNEYANWSWRYHGAVDPSGLIVRASVTVTVDGDSSLTFNYYATPVNQLWLNGFAIAATGKENKTTD